MNFITMKLTAILYSVLIFISCANNTAKEKQNEKIPPSSSKPKTVMQESALPNVAIAEKKIVADLREEVNNPPLTDSEIVIKEATKEVEAVSENTGVAEPIETMNEEKVAETLQDTTVGTVDLQENKQVVSADENSVKEVLAKVPSHKAWDVLLQKYVDNAGNVDYGAFNNSKAELSAYLEVLANNDPQSDWSKNEKLAYYINLYNAATVKLILDNYPTKSIKDIKKPWGKDIVKIGEDLVSLGYIEHKVLRKMNEPRIHFAINCASYSCPKLVNKAFTAAGMEQQLEAATKDFVNDTTRNQFTPEEAKLSEIFKWYKGDFTDKGTLKEYINTYLTTPMTANTKIKYLKYNWNLNEK